jgi:3-deoxy-7-phosphoheptulonate synthase
VSRAALAIGADGIILDVHPTPEKAAVDPLQALAYDAFGELMGQLRGIASALNRPIAS